MRCVSETGNILRGVHQEDLSLTWGSEEAPSGEARGRPGVWRVGFGALLPASNPRDPGQLVLSSLPPFVSETEITGSSAKLASPNCCGNGTKNICGSPLKALNTVVQILTIRAPEATDGVSFNPTPRSWPVSMHSRRPIRAELMLKKPSS